MLEYKNKDYESKYLNKPPVWEVVKSVAFVVVVFAVFILFLRIL